MSSLPYRGKVVKYQPREASKFTTRWVDAVCWGRGCHYSTVVLGQIRHFPEENLWFMNIWPINFLNWFGMLGNPCLAPRSCIPHFREAAQPGWRTNACMSFMSIGISPERRELTCSARARLRMNVLSAGIENGEDMEMRVQFYFRKKWFDLWLEIGIFLKMFA